MLKVGDVVQVWTGGTDFAGQAKPERKAWLGKVVQAGARRIQVRRSTAGFMARNTAFDATTGRAVSEYSSEFLKLDGE